MNRLEGRGPKCVFCQAREHHCERGTTFLLPEQSHAGYFHVKDLSG